MTAPQKNPCQNRPAWQKPLGFPLLIEIEKGQFQSKNEFQIQQVRGLAHHQYLNFLGVFVYVQLNCCALENHGKPPQWLQIPLEHEPPQPPIAKSSHPKKRSYHPQTQHRSFATVQKAVHKHLKPHFAAVD